MPRPEQVRCPKCNKTGVWDNRKDKKNPKGPDAKCANKECAQAWWGDDAEQVLDGETSSSDGIVKKAQDIFSGAPESNASAGNSPERVTGMNRTSSLYAASRVIAAAVMKGEIKLAETEAALIHLAEAVYDKYYVMTVAKPDGTVETTPF